MTLDMVAGEPWYHRIDLGENGATDGQYDFREYLPFYAIPDDLTGKRVIDVGAADGFFAFHFEGLGADVVAVNTPSWESEDVAPHRLAEWAAEPHGTETLQTAKRILSSSVEELRLSIYDLEPATVGMFDMAFCSSVLCHLFDPLRALIRLRSITRDLAIVSTIVDVSHLPAGVPASVFVGKNHVHTYWIPNLLGLHDMLVAAGFNDVRQRSLFQIRGIKDPSMGGLHAVFHARV
jgi:tRNA (mo5U34)-methyltransferase